MANNNFKLHTENIPGNLHVASTSINKRGWAEYVCCMDYNSNCTIVVFKMPAGRVKDIRKNDPGYCAAPGHDDYKGKS